MQHDLEASLRASQKLMDDFDKTTKSKLFKGVGETLKQELETAKESFLADGSAESAAALADKLKAVRTEMDNIKQSDVFQQQTTQLEKMQTKLTEMSTKNGGYDKWTDAQKNQYMQMVGQYYAYANMTGHDVTGGPPLPPGMAVPTELPNYGDAGVAVRDFNAQSQILNANLRMTAAGVKPVNQQLDGMTQYYSKRSFSVIRIALSFPEPHA